MKDRSIKIILVDDNLSFRATVKEFLKNEYNYQVIGEASNGLEFLKLKNVANADIIFMDIKMPEMDGVTATKEYCIQNSKAKIIAISSYSNQAYLKPLIEAGFKGYISKNDFYNDIKHAVDEVINNRFYFSPKIE